MTKTFHDFLLSLENEISELPVEEVSYVASNLQQNRFSKMGQLLRKKIAPLTEADRQRALAEFEGYGPLEALLEDEHVSEILVNGQDNIWVEKQGKLMQVADRFISPRSYRQAVQRICESSRTHLTVEHPMAQGTFSSFRLQIVGSELTRNETSLSLRRHPKNPWTFNRLIERSWSTEDGVTSLKKWLVQKRNFLVVGPTGSGKTSIVNACLNELPEEERVLILEDTQELCLPNSASQRLVTRHDPQRILPPISMDELVRQSLRLRPDRLVLGEIRGAEAKDFLMALSTGHEGSFGTLHASSPHQALIRLEMLIQLGAPHWGLQAIRRLIYLSLGGIVVVGRTATGERTLMGIHEITSLEEQGFLIEKIY